MRCASTHIAGTLAFALTLGGCAAPKPLPPCPEPGPPDEALVQPSELELPPEERMPEGATPPERLVAPEPALPDDAFAGSTEPAVVIVKYRVDERGEVTTTEVTRGASPFREAALEAVRGMRFRPATHEGAPIAVFQIRRFVFRHGYAHCDGQPQSNSQ